MENILERSVFESSTVDVTRHPVIIEDRSPLGIFESVMKSG